MVCKHCDREIADGMVFCPYCGSRADGNVVCPKCGELIPEEYRFCPKCGCATDAAERPKAAAQAAASVYAESEPTASDPYADGKPAERPTKGQAIAAIKKHYPLIERIALAGLAAIFFLCSFFGVIGFKYDYSNSYREDLTFRLQVPATELISFSFWTMKKTENLAIDEELAENYKTDLSKALNKKGTYDSDDQLTARGEKRIMKVSRKYVGLLLRQAYLISIDDEHDAATLFLNVKIAGVLALFEILLSAAFLIAAIVRVFLPGTKTGAKLLLTCSAALALFIGAFLSIGNEVTVLGSGYAAIVSFAVIATAYVAVRSVVLGKKAAVRQTAVGAVAAALGVLMISSLAMGSAFRFRAVDESSARKKTLARVEMSAFDGWDLFYSIYMGDPIAADSIDGSIPNGDGYTASQRNLILESQIMSYLETDEWLNDSEEARGLSLWQPSLALLQLVAAIAFLATAMRMLAGEKAAKCDLLLCSAVFLISAVMSCICFAVIGAALEDFTLLHCSVGSESILAIVFGIFGLAGAIAALFTQKKRKEKKPAPPQPEPLPEK